MDVNSVRHLAKCGHKEDSKCTQSETLLAYSHNYCFHVYATMSCIVELRMSL